MTAHPARLALLAPLLTLAACSGPGPATPEPQPVALTVQGRLASPVGAGQVSLPGWAEVRGPLAADGSFSLTLPTPAQLSGRTVTAAALLSALRCGGAVQSSDPAAQGYAVAALDAQGSGPARQVFLASGSQPGLLSRAVTAQAWVYADRETRLSGTVDCAPLLGVPGLAQLPVTVSAGLLPGWNPLTLNIQGSLSLLGGFSASGRVTNAATSGQGGLWRTVQEVQAQISFP